LVAGSREQSNVREDGAVFTEDEMNGTLKHLSNDEKGIETLEWLAIAVLILIVAFAVYPGTLQKGLLDVVTTITEKLSTTASSMGGS
jgi:Flp pilus assembly pilin Flp